MIDVDAIAPPLRDLARALFAGDDQLEPSVVEAARAGGPDAVALLISVIADPDSAATTSPGEGWAPIHAVRLLGELRAREAVPAFLNLLAHTDDLDILLDEALHALRQLGDAVVEPALARLTAGLGSELDATLLGVLADAGARDERIYDLLVRFVEIEAIAGAMNLGAYGDPRAIPILSRALDAQIVDFADEGLVGNQEIVELADAIERLGGTLTEAQRAMLDDVDAARSAWAAGSGWEPGPAPIVRAAPKIGRNDPCHCGSGKKFKKCHGAA